MLYHVHTLKGYAIRATDGEIGKIDELYFDQETWGVRYLVVDVGSWWDRQRVLLTPGVIEAINTEAETLSVSITREQVENSPDVNTQMPLSRQKEIELHAYYDWQPYWGYSAAGMPGVAMGYPAIDTIARVEAMRPPGETEQETAEETGTAENKYTLCSSNTVTGYLIQAINGEVGFVGDFVVDESNWAIRYLVIDTGNWLPGKKFLLSPGWVQEMDWLSGRVKVTLQREHIEASPPYDPDQAITPEYESALHEHYRQTDYGQQPDPAPAMLLLGKDVIGNPVISLQNGHIVGMVKDLYLDKLLNQVTGIFLGREGLFSRRSLCVHGDDVLVLGRDAVLINDDAAVRELQESEEAQWVRRSDLQSRPVNTPGGTRIGQIGDVVVELHGAVIGFGLSHIYVDGPIAENRAIVRRAVIDVGDAEEAMTINLKEAEQQKLAIIK